MAGAMGFTGISQTFGRGYEEAIDKTPKASAPTDLKIETITPAFIRGVNSLYIKITTNQGIVGYGEGVDAVPGTIIWLNVLAIALKEETP